MEMEEVFHMAGGVGQNSYAANSLLQRKVMEKVQPMVKASVTEMCKNVSKRISVADLGCALGPNTQYFIYEVLLAITEGFRQNNQCMPDVHFFLNDLPGNDFNTLFRSLVSFRAHLYHGEVGNGNNIEIAPLYISGVPGSYFGRIFPKSSMDFVHSSYSLHWLSRAPPALQSTDEVSISLSKRNIYLTKASTSIVIESYKEQHRKDFALFLESRAQEIVLGGRMILSMIGREETNPTDGNCCFLWSSLAESLDNMVSKGLIEEEELEKFNLPYYPPSLDEIRAAIQQEGSFNLERGHSYKASWDPTIDIDSSIDTNKYDDITIGRNVAKGDRPVVESMLKKHFKEIDMDELLRGYAEKVAAVPREKRFYVNIVVELKKIHS